MLFRALRPYSSVNTCYSCFSAEICKDLVKNCFLDQRSCNFQKMLISILCFFDLNNSAKLVGHMLGNSNRFYWSVFPEFITFSIFSISKSYSQFLIDNIRLEFGKLFNWIQIIIQLRLQGRCFLVNLAKFLRIPYLQNTSEQLLLGFSIHLTVFATQWFYLFLNMFYQGFQMWWISWTLHLVNFTLQNKTPSCCCMATT